MRFIKILIMALLCLNFTLIDQTDVLNQRVSLHYKEIGIEHILQHIQQQYGINFSYLNNEIPNDLKLSINIDDKPLYVALDEILKDTNLTYQVVSGQIVLKKDVNKAVQTAPKQEAENTPAKPKSVSDQPAKNTTITSQPKTEQEEQNTIQASHPQRQENEMPHIEEEQDGSEKISSKPAKPVEPLSRQKTGKEPKEQDALAMNTTSAATSSLSEKINRGLDEILFQHIPEESDYERKTVHFGFVYPLSTNGTEAGKYVNEISLHLLVGYAAGLDGVEASGFGNIENDFVKGAQFAGFFNLVKNDVEGIQGAGFMNINGGNMNGAQFSGFLNTAAGSVDGIQGAGFANIATGKSTGAQFAGFMNIVTDDANALQGAGFLNVTTGSSDGAQMAGFANIAKSAKGVQLAGFTNIVAGDVEGFQGSGFINVARNVKGVQLSVFNVADSIDGVPIGFLSIVRKNGYRALEVWGSEAFHANIGFKVGVERFYNIFAAGAQFTDSDFRWGLGYGIGTQLPSSSTFRFNIDLLSFNIYEEDNQLFENQDLNLLNTLRFGISKQFSSHFSMFIAPTFNVMVSQLQHSESNAIGSDIAPWTIYDETFDGKTNVKMWPGFQFGLRF